MDMGSRLAAFKIYPKLLQDGVSWPGLIQRMPAQIEVDLILLVRDSPSSPASRLLDQGYSLPGLSQLNRSDESG
ncbi:hypothetical protein D3C71_2083010 [compost metagenome]